MAQTYILGISATDIYVIVALAIVVAVGLIIVVATRPSTKRAARRADAVSAGRQVYVAKCAICHGREGDGSSMGPPMFSGELASLPDSSYRQAIANGVSNRRPQYGPMPPQKLSASDTDKVISYIRSAQAGPR